jgi:fibronectin-binding autotransporter adhesin
MLPFPPHAGAATRTWQGAASTDFNLSGNWAGGSPANNELVLPPTAGLQRNPALSANLTINTLSIDNSGGAYSLGAGNTLTFTGGLNPALTLTTGGNTTIGANIAFTTTNDRTFSLGGGNLTVSGTFGNMSATSPRTYTIHDGTLTLNGGIVNSPDSANDRTLTFAGNATILVNGAIVNGAASPTANRRVATGGGFTGTLRLSGDVMTRNSFVHGGGTLQIGANLDVGAGTSLNAGLEWTGGTLEAHGGARVVSGLVALSPAASDNPSTAVLASGYLRTIGGSQDLTLSQFRMALGGASSPTGTFRVTNTGLTTIGHSTGIVINNNSSTAITHTFDIQAGAHLVASAALTTVGANTTLFKTGDGILELTQAGTYAGAGGSTTVNGGTLRVSNTSGSATTGVRPVTVNSGGTVDGTGTISGAVALTGGASLASTGTLNLGSTLAVSGTNNTITGGTVSMGGLTTVTGSLSIGSGGATGALAGDIGNSGTVAFNRSTAYNFSNTISGTGALVKSGTGALTLSGTASYGGATTVNGGTLILAGTGHNSSSYTVSGASFQQTDGTAWATGLFHVNGSGTGASIQIADFADDAVNPKSILRYTVDTGGVTPIDFTHGNPFAAYYAGSAANWVNEWTIDLLTVPGLQVDQFQNLTLMSSSGLGAYNLLGLDNLLSIQAWNEGGTPTLFSNVGNGDVLYISSGDALGKFTVSFGENSFDLVFASARAIPEPGTFSLVALALLFLRRHLLKRRVQA